MCYKKKKKEQKNLQNCLQYFSVEWSSRGSSLECYISGQSNKFFTEHQLCVKIMLCTEKKSKRYPRELLLFWEKAKSQMAHVWLQNSIVFKEERLRCLVRRGSEKVSPKKPLSWALQRGNDGVLLPGRADGRLERTE